MNARSLVVGCAFLWSRALDAAPLTRVSCRRWDDAYVNAAHTTLWVLPLLTLVLALVSGLVLGRTSWLFASPKKRIFVTATSLLALAILFLQVVPRIFGLGGVLFSAIDPSYPACSTLSFGAQGLLGGVIGKNTIAYLQWPAISALLTASSMGSVLVSLAISSTVVTFKGLRRRARGGAA